MSAQFYVAQTKQKVDAIRRRLVDLGLFQDVHTAIAIEDFASMAGECNVIRLPSLTERRGLLYLAETFGLSIGDHSPSDTPLAGALCVADNARHRWILVREEDIPRRQRFTIAHELGHLFLEVESIAHNAEQHSLDIGGEANAVATVRMFSRCATTGETSSEISQVRRKPLSDAELLEVKADHFASELLMPYDGVIHLVREVGGATGIRDERTLNRLVAALSSLYDVSLAAAERRVKKDFGIVPVHDHPNHDLFS